MTDLETFMHLLYLNIWILQAVLWWDWTVTLIVSEHLHTVGSSVVGLDRNIRILQAVLWWDWTVTLIVYAHLDTAGSSVVGLDSNTYCI
jgi:hypothetical protein